MIPVQRPEGMRIKRPKMRSAIAPKPPPLRSGPGISALPQFDVQAFAIEQVIGVERNDLALRRDEVNAGALYRRDAKIVFVEELHDDDAEHLVVAEVARHLDLGQAAQQIAEHGSGALA